MPVALWRFFLMFFLMGDPNINMAMFNGELNGFGWSWMVDGVGVSVFSLGAVPYLDIMVPNLWR